MASFSILWIVEPEIQQSESELEIANGFRLADMQQWCTSRAWTPTILTVEALPLI